MTVIEQAVDDVSLRNAVDVLTDEERAAVAMKIVPRIVDLEKSPFWFIVSGLRRLAEHYKKRFGGATEQYSANGVIGVIESQARRVFKRQAMRLF